MKLQAHVMMMVMLAGGHLAVAGSKARDCGPTVKLDIIDGRPVVGGVFVNGQGPFRFLVDTGANINLIETNLARKIGMNASFQVDLTSAAGKSQTAGSDGNEVEIE